MFTPKISITGIPLDASSFILTDITGNSPTDATGYGQAGYLPQNNTEWFKQVRLQYLGANPSDLSFSPTTDNALPVATLGATLPDGIHLITVYFTKELTGLGYTLDATKKILTKTNADQWADPLGLFAGMSALIVSADENFSVDDASVISTVSNTVLNLQSTLTGGITDGNLWAIYKVQKYILVLNQGEQRLVNAIGDLALTNLACNGCNKDLTDPLMDTLMLKFSAQINFNCGNYAKAHNAALLLSNSDSTVNCTTC